MAAESGTKSKGKKKGIKLSLDDMMPGNPFKIDWAEEMEDQDVRVPQISLPTAPKATTGVDVDLNQVPNYPPFKAFLSNLSWEVTQQNIINFFPTLKVKSVNLLGDPGRPNGRAHVEFETREDLIEALHMSGKMLDRRAITIQLPNGMGDRMGGGFGRGRYADTTPMNWREREGVPPRTATVPPPTEPEYMGRDGGYGRGGFGDRYGRRDDRYGSRPRYDDDSSWTRRAPPPPSESEGNWRTNRPPPPPPSEPSDFDRPYGRGRNQGPRRRDGDYDDRDYGDRFGSRMDRRDNRDRDFDRAPRDDYDRPPSREAEPAPPAQPKERFNLKDILMEIQAADEPEKPTTYNSIFGGAKPVNTLEKELEIERKLQEARQQADSKKAGSNHGGSDAGSVTSERNAKPGQKDDQVSNNGDAPPPAAREERRGDRPRDGERFRERGPRRDDRNGRGGRGGERGERGDRGFDRDRRSRRDGDRADRGDRYDRPRYDRPPRDGPSDRYNRKPFNDQAPRRFNDEFPVEEKAPVYVNTNKFSELVEDD